MPRQRRSSSDNGASLIFVILLAAVWVIVAVVKLALTVTFFAFPLLVALAVLKAGRVSPNPPKLPDPNCYDPLERAEQIRELVGKRHWLQSARRQLCDAGRENGIHLTDASGGTRFDRRSSLGRELNENLDTAERAIEQVTVEIADIRASVFRALPEWDLEYRTWARARALTAALKVSITCGLIVTAASLASLEFKPEFLADLSSFLIYQPFPTLVIGPLLTGVIASYTVAYPTFRIVYNRSTEALDDFIGSPWRALEAKWSAHTDVERFFPPRSPFDPSRGNARTKSQPSATQSWHAILGVEPDASPEQIKTAYREAIKGYHSDRVVGLGEKIRALAEEQSKLINAAYAEAKIAREFS